MALPFALRPRIRLRDEPAKARPAWAVPLALPVAAYWAAMGALTYGVAKAGSGSAPFAPREPVPVVAAASLGVRLPADVPLESAPSSEIAQPLRLTVPPRATEASPAALTRMALLHGTAFRDEPRADDARPAASAALTVTPAASTCESVLAAEGDQIDLTSARRAAPDVSREAYAAILENGSYLSSCAIPDGTAVEVCAAVRQGRSIGVTVVTVPPDARVNTCVRGKVASLAFPTSSRLDVTRTRFEPLRRR